jgi:integrase
MRRAGRAKIQRPEQAQGLTHEILQQILDGRPTALNELRDTALISVGYDTLCRSSEIARMRIEHLNRGPGSAISILIPISKADSFGNGRITHLSPTTVEHLKNWIDASNIVEGPIFQGLHLGHPSGLPLKTSSIRRIVKRAALRAGVRDNVADRLSGHSMRIGAAQDMMVNGFDMLAIMQAGGWRKPDVVLRYVENAATRRLHERRWAALSDGAISRP